VNFLFMLDPLYWLLIGPAMLLAVYAQMKVKGTYTRYSRIANRRGYTGAQAAARILDTAGIRNVRIEMARGWLSDHYDPRSRKLRLSSEVYSGRSVAAVGIAAHEVGHAVQHATGYAPLHLRSAMASTAGLGSFLAMPMIVLGYFLASFALIKLGIILFSALVVFQLVTLPVEINASSRAKKALTASGIVGTREEAAGVNSVLNAAALTYVAATITAIAQLLFFLLRFGLIGGGDD